MNGQPFRIVFFFLTLFIPVLLSGQGLENGLLLHYPLNGNAQDALGKFNGTVVGATPAPDRFGNNNGAMQFDGNSRIEFPAAGALKPQPPLSLSFWVRFDDTGAGSRAILTTDFQANAFFGVTLGLDAANRLQVTLAGASVTKTFRGATTLLSGVWHFMGVAVTSEDAVDVYLNGCKETLTETGTIPRLNYSSQGVGNLGRANAAGPPVQTNTLRGRLDDLRYWNRVLTEEEADQLYARFNTPEISLGNDTMICIGETLELSPQTTVAAWTWNDGSTGQTFTVSETGKYWVTANTPDCQEISDTIDVMVGFCDNCAPAAPNAFTPNGDGKNDTFRVLFDPQKCRIVDAHVMIFNRWGRKVFETNNADDRWDGRAEAKDQPSDVYIYVVRYAYESEQGRITKEIKGDVTLIR